MKIHNLCVLDTPYSLLVYLLYKGTECINNTYFVFGNNINESITNKIPHKAIINTIKTKHFGKLINSLSYKFQIITKIPFNLKYKHIYAHDHLHFFPLIIGKQEYTLVEDSPNICTNYENSKNYIKHNTNKKSNILLRLLYGKLYNKVFGNNNQCRSLLLTKKDNAEYIKGKTQIIFSLNNNWKTLNEIQQEIILDIFGLTSEDIRILKSKSYILFTQPITDFHSINLDKQGNIYKNIISNYPKGSILIKVHPRDEYPYEEKFPQCLIFRKSIPSQLLDIIGIRYQKAITLFSTAATSFNYPIEVDWYGTKIDSDLYNDVGDVPCPLNK